MKVIFWYAEITCNPFSKTLFSVWMFSENVVKMQLFKCCANLSIVVNGVPENQLVDHLRGCDSTLESATIEEWLRFHFCFCFTGDLTVWLKVLCSPGDAQYPNKDI